MDEELALFCRMMQGRKVGGHVAGNLAVNYFLGK
jgi:hypothetical protein